MKIFPSIGNKTFKMYKKLKQQGVNLRWFIQDCCKQRKKCSVMTTADTCRVTIKYVKNVINVENILDRWAITDNCH